MAFIGLTKNEYGTTVSQHTCDTCGVDFTTTFIADPDNPDEGRRDYSAWGGCMAPRCGSYDASRDVDKFLNEEGTLCTVDGESVDGVRVLSNVPGEP